MWNRPNGHGVLKNFVNLIVCFEWTSLKVPCSKCNKRSLGLK